MADIRITSATLDDIEAKFGELPFVRARAMTARIDGEIVGVGGIATLPNGTATAFLDIDQDMRTRAPFTLFRACRNGLRAAVKRGVTSVSAVASPDIPKAREFLERLGFRLIDAKAGYYLYEARHERT